MQDPLRPGVQIRTTSRSWAARALRAEGGDRALKLGIRWRAAADLSEEDRGDAPGAGCRQRLVDGHMRTQPAVPYRSVEDEDGHTSAEPLQLWCQVGDDGGVHDRSCAPGHAPGVGWEARILPCGTPRALKASDADVPFPGCG
jgi:hypothetical protein